MPRDNPRRITKRKLLRFTAQQSECKDILAKLERHDRMVAKLKRAGWNYDPDKGTLEIPPDRLLHPEDLKDDA